MGFRISNIHEYDRFIAIDLGSYRVRASLFSLSEGKLELEGRASIRQQKKNMQEWAIIDMQWVAHTIEKAIHEACRNIDEIPENIIMAFSPATCIHDIIVSQYIREDSEHPISMDELDTMIEKIEKTSLERAKQKAKMQYAILRDDIRLISSTLTSISIDGKKIMNPIGLHGKYVRITILNIYTLASEYNIIRSILSSLKKKTISLVPMPLVLPKIIEKWEHMYDDNIYINFGYTHVTIVFDKKHEITYLDTFTMGTKMLIDMISNAYPSSSYTQTESFLMRQDPTDEEKGSREALVREYLSYTVDVLASVIHSANELIRTKHIFVSGGIFSSSWIEALFFDILSENIGYDGKHLHLGQTSETDMIPPDYTITHGLAYLGQELLYTKKDPLIRILRYTLYHYE
jgi:adenylate kinase family enzyme